MKWQELRVWCVLVVLLGVAAAGGNYSGSGTDQAQDHEERVKEAREKEAQTTEGITQKTKTVTQAQKPVTSDEEKTTADEKARDQNTKEEGKPANVIFILADDLGYGDLGYTGHPTSRTPNIDKLEANSRIFDQYYVTTLVCSPARAALLTGRVPVRSGVYPHVF